MREAVIFRLTAQLLLRKGRDSAETNEQDQGDKSYDDCESFGYKAW
jgi:hypothetical protein